jgi:hypothetical protein
MIKEVTPLLGYISWSNFPWIIFNVLKNFSYGAHNTKKMTPMDLEHPKTPSWDFSTPGLANKMKQLHLLEVFPFKIVVPALQNTPTDRLTQPLCVFHTKTHTHVHPAKIRHFVEQLAGLAPP